MEPSSVEDGNLSVWRCTRRKSALQWSRPQLRTETISGGAADLDEALLQWSRPQLRTETPQIPIRLRVDFVASMEPSSVEDGNTHSGV